ncbi:PD-(D/E)XK nuclease family protein, partial [Bacillus sp. GbtcB13]|uniref:PD-(D/E)XK nuclease family protein n=1 Tax=Bacillus sp. GbtcB13 TaxID=2824758 RepID=UPI001C2FA81B
VENWNRHVSRDVYGEHIQGSVSRMETSKACPFSHLASHGLKLKERQFFKLEAPDMGKLFPSGRRRIQVGLHGLKLDWRA